jgi:hypothetical protein
MWLALSFGLSLSFTATPTWAEAPVVGSGHMQNCPAAVPGAKTEIKDGPDGVQITVTSDSAAKVDEIRKRAKHVVEVAKADPTTVAHNGDGHGGGGLGRCEVVLKDTVVTSEDVQGGSRLTVKPTRTIDLDWLKKEIATRHAANNRKSPAKKSVKTAQNE